MRITHLGHACLLVETADARILFDPGTESSGFESLSGLSAVLITHEHPDHLDLDRLPALLAANPTAIVVVPAELAATVPGSRAAAPGDRFDLGGTSVEVLGGAHAFVYGSVPQMANLAYLVDGGAFFHPGDSFEVPAMPVDVLALATSGPWLKVADSIDFVTAVAPRIAIPMHEALLADTTTAYELIGAFAPEGTTLQQLERGVATEV
ncbi:MBL fold metallo-hydrolase [soil metagenome]